MADRIKQAQLQERSAALEERVRRFCTYAREQEQRIKELEAEIKRLKGRAKGVEGVGIEPVNDWPQPPQCPGRGPLGRWLHI